MSTFNQGDLLIAIRKMMKSDAALKKLQEQVSFLQEAMRVQAVGLSELFIQGGEEVPLCYQYDGRELVFDSDISLLPEHRRHEGITINPLPGNIVDLRHELSKLPSASKRK